MNKTIYEGAICDTLLRRRVRRVYRVAKLKSYGITESTARRSHHLVSRKRLPLLIGQEESYAATPPDQGGEFNVSYKKPKP